MDFAKFLSNVSQRRRTSIVRHWTKKFMECENAISLAAGMPNATMFPIEEIDVTYRGGTKVKLTKQQLALSLQYGPSQGYLPLVKKMREFQEHWHPPKYDDWDLLFTAGSMDGCSKVFEMLLDAGDPAMIQVPTYDGILGAILPLMPEIIEIPQDRDGIMPESIKKVCQERLRAGKKLPKILYVNATGANPTGTVLTEARRREIYELAEAYDFLILEDDPYRFILFEDKRPITFLELDTSGRVIRLDSFSKVLSAGIRLGVVTAHKELTKNLIMHMESSSLHASSLSQMLLFKLLTAWDTQKLQEHFNEVRQFYRERRDVMLSLIEKHLTGLAEWNVPRGGMFVWIKVNNVKDVMELTSEKCMSQGIFVLPGHAFNQERSKPSQHLRLCYSYATPEQIDKALATLAKLIREEVAK